MSDMAHIWRHARGEARGLSGLISERISEYEWKNPGLFTDLRGAKELLLASDYGGQHKDASYESYAFLLANISESREWSCRRRWLRLNVLRNDRRMSFKAVRGKRDIPVLNEFLKVADAFPGVLVTFLISKRVGRLLSAKPNPEKFLELVSVERGWNMKVFDRLSLIAHLGSLIVGGLCGSDQDLIWVTDRDEIAPNRKKFDRAGWVLWYHLCQYAPNIGGKLVFVTTEAGAVQPRLEDAVSVADLGAGALAEVLSGVESMEHEKLLLPITQGFSEKTDAILQWLGCKGGGLTKIGVVIDCDHGDGMRIRVVGPSILCNRDRISGVFIE